MKKHSTQSGPQGKVRKGSQQPLKGYHETLKALATREEEKPQDSDWERDMRKEFHKLLGQIIKEKRIDEVATEWIEMISKLLSGREREMYERGKREGAINVLFARDLQTTKSVADEIRSWAKYEVIEKIKNHACQSSVCRHHRALILKELER
jgi:hypothetical protein